MKPQISETQTVAESRFLSLKTIRYRDAGGAERHWESCDRIGGRGAVCILARIVPDDEILLIRQFRPPAGRFLLEFPAGLIDEGETAEQTAIRELYEETGYAGRVIHCCRPGWSSPGMTGETIALVTMEIDGDACRGQEIQAHPEENEHIEVFRVSVPKLAEFIAAQEAEEVGIDSKIYSLLAGIQLGSGA